MATTQMHPSPFSNDYVGSRRIEVRRDFRFRYGYICRLIDDSELDGMPAALRTRTRSFHKETYWKSVSLLRREKMAANREWDFQSLVNDYARVQLLLAKLTVAGMSHSVRLGAGLEGARQACREFEAFLTPSLVPVATA
jgi:hypothetical protein